MCEVEGRDARERKKGMRERKKEERVADTAEDSTREVGRSLTGVCERNNKE